MRSRNTLQPEILVSGGYLFTVSKLERTIDLLRSVHRGTSNWPYFKLNRVNTRKVTIVLRSAMLFLLPGVIVPSYAQQHEQEKQPAQKQQQAKPAQPQQQARREANSTGSAPAAD